MKKSENDFARFLSIFLSQYLPGELNASKNTISSYRDTFKLFLIFGETEKGIRPDRLRLNMISKDFVISFLDWVEGTRKCSISTRNQRLAALHAFIKFVLKDNPENLFEMQKILAIPMKKHPRPNIQFLTIREMEILLAQPDLKVESGKRDLVMLAFLYDSGARVQELIDLTRKDIRLDDPAVVCLHGKGRKTRIVPIMSHTKSLLEDYLMNLRQYTKYAPQDAPVFYNQQKEKLTRRGVSYILGKYVDKAREHPEFHNLSKLTCHTLRHSRASHMLQAGIPLIYIRDFLGHVSITSTEIYARLDTEMKRKAIEEAYIELNVNDLPAWGKDTELMSWLQNLCR